MNLMMIKGKRPNITWISDNLYVVKEIVSIDVDMKQNYR
jgi:hypothetical protein